MSRRRSRLVAVAAVCVAQLGLVGVAVAGPLSARLTGQDFLVEVSPVDPVDPFRGAYVDLGYPTLNGSPNTRIWRPDEVPGEAGELFVPLVRDGDLWRGGVPTRTRPQGVPYLRCDDSQWRLRCGIESWFLPQGRARGLERAVASGAAVARIRVDGRGNAALVDVEVRPAG